MLDAIVIGISGLSCSGKSTLASALAGLLAHSVLIHQDDYFKDYQDIPLLNGSKHFDCTDALDAAKLRGAVLQAARHPHRLCRRCSPTSRSAPQPDSPASAAHPALEGLASRLGDRHVVVAEGSLLFAEDLGLADTFQLKFMLRLDSPATARARRALRTYDEFPDPPGYFDNVVWPAFEHYAQSVARDARVVAVNADSSSEAMLAEVLERVAAHYAL